MSAVKINDSTYQIPLGIVNAYLIVRKHITVIDTGTPGNAEKILAAVHSLGKTTADIRHILLTHLHADHTGSALALKTAIDNSGGHAEVFMHALDASAFEQGQVMRPSAVSPGILKRLIIPLVKMIIRPVQVQPVGVDHLLTDFEILPFAGDLQVIPTPGHTAGHVAFFSPHAGGLLFAGDACGNINGKLDDPLLYEDMQMGRATLQKLSRLTFESAVFGHGKPILTHASQLFLKKWPSTGAKST